MDNDNKLELGMSKVHVDFYEQLGNTQHYVGWKAPNGESLGGDGTANRKEGSEQVNQPVKVSLDESHLGHEIKGAGSFELKNMFSQEANMLGSDNNKFTRVYFRTKTGNIYSLNEHGRLLDGRASSKAGTNVESELDTKELEKAKLVIGEPFRYGNGGQTTEVIEIVAATDRQYFPDYLKTMTANRHNPIRDELVQRTFTTQRGPVLDYCSVKA
jgi:hypothetical protein